jgi:flavin reductase (DIM6/NTAB) family NADH-FMN oxidoreductase RutF
MNMPRKLVPIDSLTLGPIQAFEEWLLLTAGDLAAGRYNPMTVSWGSLGVMWGRPFVQVVVRPTRHTYGFIEEFDTFTLAAFPPDYRKVLEVLGSKSGRDTDKIKLTGLTPEPSTEVAAPSYAEAGLILECKKVYWHDYDPAHFLAPYIEQQYRNDYHRAYFGEILAVTASDHYTTAR